MRKAPKALLLSASTCTHSHMLAHTQTQTCRFANIRTLIATMWMRYACGKYVILPPKGKSEVNRNGVFTIFAS